MPRKKDVVAERLGIPAHSLSCEAEAWLVGLVDILAMTGADFHCNTRLPLLSLI